MMSMFQHSSKKSSVRFPSLLDNLLIIVRDSIYAIARICYRPSVCPSGTRVDQSKTVEVKIMQLSPLSSHGPLNNLPRTLPVEPASVTDRDKM